MRVSAAGNMPLQGLVKPPAKPVVMICFITVYELVRDPTHQRDLLYSPILDYCGIKSRIKFGQQRKNTNW